MTTGEWLLVLGGFLMGFATADAIYWFTRLGKPARPPRTVADGWDQIKHVRVIGGRK